MKIDKRYKILTTLSVCLSIIICIFIINLKIHRPPNIILITIDALRADHLGCYGYRRDTSPNIDRLAKEGAIFLNCFSTAPETVHSFVTLLTGRYLYIQAGSSYISLDNLLDKKFTTLSEYLRKAGYSTLAFLNNENLRSGKGFEQGFDYFENKLNDAEKITTNILNSLNNYRGNKPLFIWIHYMDPHAPYTPPIEYFKIFENDKLYNENDKILELSPRVVSDPYSHRTLNYIPENVFHKDKYNLNYYIACYDADILYIDFYLGRLLRNTDDNTIIILTADHGEYLGEHNIYFTHGENVYDEVLHTPLIIKDNRTFKGGKRISTIVSSVDIVPTILSRINPIWCFFNKNRFDGRDLKRTAKDKDIRRNYIYSYFPLVKSIRDVRKNIKYILFENGKEELFFLPDEYTNYTKAESLRVTYIKNKLSGDLKKWLKHFPAPSDINSKKMFLNEDQKKITKKHGVSSVTRTPYILMPEDLCRCASCLSE